jgi:hypothetical protein
MSWKVCTPKGNWIGIVESNYQWASQYWPKRGYRLIPY